jgi:prepilin-type N-terminal cleavage/methylation domain-containing protein
MYEKLNSTQLNSTQLNSTQLKDKMRLKSGFTLVELAIVIVVIGLLVGGVLQGQELIKQAEIRSLISQLREYDTASNTFLAKYNAIPGDFNKANAFGININPNNGIINVAATLNAFGDGNGNGTIQSYGNLDIGEYMGGESLNFWTHLSNLGLIKQSLSQESECSDGSSGPNSCSYIPGKNIPSVKLKNSAIGILHDRNLNSAVFILGTKGYFQSDYYYYGNVFDPETGTDGGLYSNSFDSEISYSIDIKIDDGRPLKGMISAISGIDFVSIEDYSFSLSNTNSNSCALTDNEYNLSSKENLCTLRLKLDL